MLCENPGDIQGWQTDHDGRLRVAYAIVDGVTADPLPRNRSRAFRPVLTTNFKKSVSFAASPRQALAGSAPSPTSTRQGRPRADGSCNVRGDRTALRKRQIRLGQHSYSATRRRKTAGVSYTGHKGTARHFFDGRRAIIGRMEAPARRHRHRRLEQGRGQIHRLCRRRPHDGHLLLLRRRGRHDDQAGRPRAVDRREQMAEMIPINYTSARRLEIEGY